MLSADATSTPIFWGHGTSDAVVPYKFGVGSVQILKEKLGFKDVEFKPYRGMGHSSDTQEIVDLSTWLKKVIPA
jgi:predicted esterase